MRQGYLKTMTVFFCIAVVCTGIRGRGSADVLELVDGSVISGNYIGGTADAIQFEFIGGVGTFRRSDVLSLSLGEEGRLKDLAPDRAISAFYSLVGPVTVPARTVLPVYIFEGISSRIYGPEYMFTGMLLVDVVANGFLLVERGTQVVGRIKRVKGRSRYSTRGWFKLELTQILIGGIAYYMETSWVRARNEVAVRSSMNRVRAAQNASGFRAGDAVGTAGPIQTSGKWIEVPPGTVVEFGLAKPLVFSVYTAGASR